MFKTKFFKKAFQSTQAMLILLVMIFCVNISNSQIEYKATIFIAKDFQVTNQSAIYLPEVNLHNEKNINENLQSLHSKSKTDETKESKIDTIYLMQGTIFYSKVKNFLSNNEIIILKKNRIKNRKSAQRFAVKEVKKINKQKPLNIIKTNSPLVWFYKLAENYLVSFSNNYLKIKKSILSYSLKTLNIIELPYLKQSYCDFNTYKCVKIVMDFYTRPPPKV